MLTTSQCFCTGACRYGLCPSGGPGVATTYVESDGKPWQCPGCKEWKAPHTTSCDCETQIDLMRPRRKLGGS